MIFPDFHTDARMKLGKMPNSDGKHPTGDTPKIETGDSTTLGSPEMPTPESPGENTPKQVTNVCKRRTHFTRCL